jgi:hypothetical protein
MVKIFDANTGCAQMNWVTATQTHHHDLKSDLIFQIKVRRTTSELDGSVIVTRNNHCTLPFLLIRIPPHSAPVRKIHETSDSSILSNVTRYVDS